MSTLAKKSRVLLTLLLVLVMLIPLFQGIRVFASYDIVHFTGFESGKDGWTSYYGGSVAISNEEASASEHSLKMTGRTKSWHSPGKNIYSIIRENGAGEYRITISVLISSVNPGNDYVGMLIRTNRTYSFSTNHNGNIYCRLGGKYKGITSGEWFTVEGNVTVSDDDISPISGEFDLMLDLIEPVDGQAVYIDNVVIRKKTEPDPLVIDKTSMNLYIGETMKINANKQYGIAFRSENKSIATVDSTGLVTAVSAGQTTIQVMTGSEKRYCTVTVEPRYHVLADGMYLVRNTDKGIFMQVPADDIANENAAVNLLEYNGGTQQHWEIAYAGSGYYKIVNRRSGKVLSVQDNSANTDNKNLVQKTYTGANEQKWQIIPLGDGNYKFKPKSGEGYSSDWCAAANGNKVQQRQFVESGTNKYIGEWTLFDMNKPFITLDTSYDDGYTKMYSDNYANKIKDCSTAIQRVFLRDFGIFVADNNVGKVTSLADTCGYDYSLPCLHAPVDYCSNENEDLLHHKNVYNILDCVSVPESKHVNMLYTGHETCAITELGHRFNEVYGLAYPASRRLLFSNKQPQSITRLVTVHEFGHVMGAPDHYGDGCPTTDEINIDYSTTLFSDNCIYGYNREDSSIKSNMTTCAGCKVEINKKINEMRGN